MYRKMSTLFVVESDNLSSQQERKESNLARSERTPSMKGKSRRNQMGKVNITHTPTGYPDEVIAASNEFDKHNMGTYKRS
jgi:hypothetical protein